MAESNASSYFLSASQETSSRSRLFRPRELREFVFPGVGMIMHSLFWVKYTAHLHQRNINPAAQDRLLLYAKPEDGEPLYDEGLLWYILASRLEADVAVQLTAGVKTVKDYLFAPQYEYDGDVYDRVAAELQRMDSQGESYDAGRFVDEVFAPWFVTRCSDRGIDLETKLKQDVLPDADADAAETASESRERRVLAGFCTLIGRLIREHEELQGTSDLNVIGTTIAFAVQLLLPENESQLAILAETSFAFTPAQTTALLQAVANIDRGEHFVRSILFVTHIGPLRHSGSEFDREMRRIHDIVTTQPETVLESGADLVEYAALPAAATENLDETSYYWLLNFFMADGETISRELLDTDGMTLRREAVEAYFETGGDRTGTFADFLTRPEDGRTYIPRILAAVDPAESPRVYRFLEQLLHTLEQGTDPPGTLLSLLEANGVIEPESDEKETYRIREFPSNTNSASFYGIGPLRSWTTTLLDANE